jgi:hypothetical protein
MYRQWSGSIRKPAEVRPDGKLAVQFGADPTLVRDGLGLAVVLHECSVALWLKACTSSGSEAGAPEPRVGSLLAWGRRDRVETDALTEVPLTGRRPS